MENDNKNILPAEIPQTDMVLSVGYRVKSHRGIWLWENVKNHNIL